MSNFFSSPWFLEACAEVLLPGSGARPSTVEVEGRRFDTLVLPDGSVAGNPLSDFLEPLAQEQPSLGEVTPVRSLPRVALERVAVTHPPTQVPGRTPSPCIDWRGFDSFEDYVQQTQARNWRAFKTTGRKRRKLARNLGAVRIELACSDHQLVEHALIHKARQLRHTGGLDRFVARRTRQLLHLLVQSGHLDLSVLWAGDRPLAFALAHWGPDRCGSWIVSYDPDASDTSPGTQLYEAMMEASFARGHAEFDFLIGAEPYKYHYATHERLVGPTGEASTTARLVGGVRSALEADAPPRRLRHAAHQLALHAARLRLEHQPPAPIDDAPFRDVIEDWSPGWPRVRHVDPLACQHAQLLSQADLGAWDTVRTRAWRALRDARQLAKQGAQLLAPEPETDSSTPSPSPTRKLRPGATVLVRQPDAVQRALREGDEPGLGYGCDTLERYAGQVLTLQRRVGAHFDPHLQRTLRPDGLVVLDGAVCDGSPASHRGGCDRGCDLFWSEGMLDLPEPDSSTNPPPDQVEGSQRNDERWVTVRSLDEIEAAEDERPDPAGVHFVPDTMACFCGQRFRVRAPVHQVYDHSSDRAIPLDDVFLLDGVVCSGAPLLAAGGCDRRCALLWRGAWLEERER